MQVRTIAIDLTPVLPGGENGGAKIFVLELIKQLAALRPEVRFVLLTQAASHGELAALEQANVTRRCVTGAGAPSGALRSWLQRVGRRVLAHLPARAAGRVARLGLRVSDGLKRGIGPSVLGDIGADLLFCPFTAPTFFEAGIPTVCTIYDLQYKTFPQFFSPEDVQHRERTFVEACRRATALAAISDYSRASALEHGGLEPARIRTIHLRMAQRVDAAGGALPATLVERLGIYAHRYLLYPANFWKHKNHEILLTAFGMAVRQGLPPDIKLICTGAPGERRDWLERAAQAMGLGDRVCFPGFLPTDDLVALLTHAKAVVFPSLYEGFGIPLIEAMAAGVPVACSNVTSLPEVADGAALLFDPRKPADVARAMVALAEDSQLVRSMVVAGTKRAAEFADAGRMAREYWDLFSFAMEHAKQETLLTGAYTDGWAGPRLAVQVAPAESPQILELEFSVPEWSPHENVQVSARRQRGAAEGASLPLRRGHGGTLTLEFAASGGAAEIVISPTFVPAQLGYGDDVRELSVMVRRCCVVRTAGAPLQLFPEAAQ